MGTLRGFDEYVNMVLDDVVEKEYTAVGIKEVCKTHDFFYFWSYYPYYFFMIFF